MSTDANDLAEFDEQAAPKGLIKVNDLVDGTYCLEIRKGAYKKSKEKQTKMLILSCQIITSPGGEFDNGSTEVLRFMTDQSKFNETLIDVQKLGFDVENWKQANSRPASAELMKALLCMPGVRFRGKKRVSGTFHEIVIEERIVNDGRPTRFTAEHLNEVQNDDVFA